MIARGNHIWEALVELCLIALAFLAVFAVGALYFSFEREVKEKQDLEKKLGVACQIIDDNFFDGDPQPCLDPEGNPYNHR